MDALTLATYLSGSASGHVETTARVVALTGEIWMVDYIKFRIFLEFRKYNLTYQGFFRLAAVKPPIDNREA